MLDETQTERDFKAELERTLQLATFADIDTRRTPFFQVRQLARRIARDMGDNLSTAQAQLVQRAATLGALCEHTEIQLLLGQPASVPDFLQMINTQRRLLTTLGLRRVPKDITDPLAYARQRDQAAAET
jgi:hypothetical protein